MKELDKQLSGKLYLPTDEEIALLQKSCLEKQFEFNQLPPSRIEERETLLKEMFAEFGEGSYVEPPLHCNFGGCFIHFGKNVYANFNLTCVDDTHIYVGDNTIFGPNVTIITTGHPIQPELRQKQYQFSRPARFGKNVWIGAGVVILPGVTIGDNSVIGAGSLVSHDIPANVVAYGTPARVVRPIGEKDDIYYFKNEKIDWNEFR
ncbi:sugar O-acetyltransferase [Allobaculum mucilyticum]|uniref:sugar O-acetyltransferase n=1 Tax=Allobaculum mucilyticum TaxID=2834459 RepID=UPI001E3E3756|nr:sugar O-acetyltransferase [Allobaculum mucilyticum]UNT97302.1 sugar O-acetyltransferase [Allobaculum mucilyticum]